MIILDTHIFDGRPGQPALLMIQTTRGTFWRFQPVAPLAPATPAALMFEMEGSGI